MISAPYNFVPLAHKVYYPDWVSLVSQDVPFPDGEDGVIDLEIRNMTPLFVRNGHKRDEEMPYSSHVLLPNGERRYFIPGTSVKGCIRSVLEILTFGKMGPYNNDSFGMQREFDTNKSTNKSYMEIMKHASCGWMIRDIDGNYHIDECAKGVQLISHAQLKEKFPCFDVGEDHQTAQRKQENLDPNGETYPLLQVREDEITYTKNNQQTSVPAGTYRVVCTGYMDKDKKTHEYLFSEGYFTRYEVSAEVFQAFDSVHKRTDYYAGHGGQTGYLRGRLMAGKPIPVFFTKNAQKVEAIGIARMFRYPFAHNIKELVANSRQELSSPDMAETMFGYVNGSDALKGRIQFSHAFCDDQIKDSQLISLSGVLGQPSASYYPLYLRQKQSPYKTYDDNAEIAGRKRYRVTDGNTAELPQGNGNDNLLGHFQFIPSGHTFHCQIRVHNLRKVEIGALLAAITMNHTPGCFLNLGLAKSFGYGKLQCSVRLTGFAHNEEDYLKAYEFEMLRNELYIDTEESICNLVSIASEHSIDSMQMMQTPKDYEVQKKNSNFDRLKEKPKRINTYLTSEDITTFTHACVERQAEEERKRRERQAEEERKRRERQAEEERKASLFGILADNQKNCKAQMAAKLWAQAMDIISVSIPIAQELGNSTAEWEQMLQQCEQAMAAELAAKQNQTLADALVGKTSAGNIIGTTKKWLKTMGREFTESDFPAFMDSLTNLPVKEQKVLASKKKDLESAIGLDWADRVIKAMTKS